MKKSIIAKSETSTFQAVYLIAIIIVLASVALGFFVSLGAYNFSSIIKMASVVPNCGTLDPLSVSCMNSCGYNNSTDADRLNCVKNSCNAKYGTGTQYANDCANPIRVSFINVSGHGFDAFGKVGYYCSTAMGNPKGSPTSTECLMACSYDMTKKEAIVQQVCNAKVNNDISKSLTCQNQVNFGIYNLINTVTNCSNMENDSLALSNCRFNIAKSSGGNQTTANTLALKICTLFNNCSSTVPILDNTGSKNSSSVLDELKKGYITGYMVERDSFSCDLCGNCNCNAHLHTGYPGSPQIYNSVPAGNFPGFLAICPSSLSRDEAAHEGLDLCSQLKNSLASGKADPSYTNESIQETINSCKKYSLPASAYACKKSCLCALASQTGLDKSFHKACSTCFAPDFSSTKCDGTKILPTDIQTDYAFGPFGKATGQADLIAKTAAMLSGVVGSGCQLPAGSPLAGCTIKSSMGPRPKNPTSPHITGQAIDFCCMGSGFTESGCTDQNKLEILKNAATSAGLSTIRECTASERITGGTDGCTGGLLHIANR